MDISRIAMAQTPVQIAVAKVVQDVARVQSEGVAQMIDSTPTGSGQSNAEQQGRNLDARA